MSATFVIRGGVTYGSTQEVDLYATKGKDSLRQLDYMEPSFKSKKKRMSVLSGMFEDNLNVYKQFIADDKFSFGQIRSFIHFI